MKHTYTPGYHRRHNGSIHTVAEEPRRLLSRRKFWILAAVLYSFPVTASVMVLDVLCVIWSALGYSSARYVNL